MQKHPITDKIEIPTNYYIDINGGASITCGHLRTSQYGECYVSVYKSLDANHGSPPVEHLVKVDDFRIDDVSNMNVKDFLNQIREGIEKIIDNAK